MGPHSSVTSSSQISDLAALEYGRKRDSSAIGAHGAEAGPDSVSWGRRRSITEEMVKGRDDGVIRSSDGLEEPASTDVSYGPSKRDNGVINAHDAEIAANTDVSYGPSEKGKKKRRANGTIEADDGSTAKPDGASWGRRSAVPEDPADNGVIYGDEKKLRLHRDNGITEEGDVAGNGGLAWGRRQD